MAHSSLTSYARITFTYSKQTYERTCQYKLSSRYFVDLVGVGVAVASSLTPWRGSVAYCWACRLNWITRTSPRTSCTDGRYCHGRLMSKWRILRHVGVGFSCDSLWPRQIRMRITTDVCTCTCKHSCMANYAGLCFVCLLRVMLTLWRRQRSTLTKTSHNNVHTCDMTSPCAVATCSEHSTVSYIVIQHSKFISRLWRHVSDVDFAFEWRDVHVQEDKWVTDEYDIFEVLGR